MVSGKSLFIARGFSPTPSYRRGWNKSLSVLPTSSPATAPTHGLKSRRSTITTKRIIPVFICPGRLLRGRPACSLACVTKGTFCYLDSQVRYVPIVTLSGKKIAEGNFGYRGRGEGELKVLCNLYYSANNSTVPIDLNWFENRVKWHEIGIWTIPNQLFDRSLC